MGGFKIAGGALAALIIGFILLIIIASMSIFGWGFFQRSTADFRGQTDAIEQVQADGDFRVAAYNHFFDLCSAVQADEGRIEIMEEELNSETVSDDRASTLRVNLTAVKSARAEKIAQYNADASKEFTQGQFRDASLPWRLNPDDMNTSCS